MKFILHREKIYSLAKRNETFCVSWEDETADAWWTHNPLWYVSIENEKGYCFSPFENSTKNDFMQRLYNN